MAVVFSRWASVTPAINGSFAPGEWSGAGILPMPGGRILVQNDSKFLYLAIDLAADTGNSPGVGDYFWISFDNTRDGKITPRKDVNYGIYPALPIRIARQYYLGPGTWTTILPEASDSLAQQGFAASSISATPHRIWELRIALSEIGLPLLGDSTAPFLRFGLRVASSTPSLVTDFPAGFFNSFAGLHEIRLATSPAAAYPPGSAGPVIAGVGLIPTSKITGGRASTAYPYQPTVTNAAFGGVLNFISNRATITAQIGAGATRYQVLHRNAPGSPFTPLRRSWANYRRTGGSDVLETFGPDANDAYPLRDPSIEYSTRDLLIQLDTAGSLGYPPLSTGLHEFRVVFLNATGGVVTSPAQTVLLYIDNVQPELQLYEITYKGSVVAPCSIIEITETPEPVRVHFRAFDPEGNLASFGLNAYYGGPSTPSIKLLPTGMGSYPGGNWQGVPEQWIDCPTSPKFPPTSCAYQFRLSATARVTNGYGYLGYSEVSSHVTFQRAGAPPFATAKALMMPFGFQAGPDNLYAVGMS
ncbi:MAG: hypothetical protein ACK5N0_00650 [Synechococcaceae cyanobacterium]